LVWSTLACSAAGEDERRSVPARSIRAATFNLQKLGRSKLELPEVTEELVEALRRYSFVAVQELSDATGQAPLELLERLNDGSGRYELALSERTGREPGDTNFREQYGFYYDRERVELLEAGRLYDDSAADCFVREPYVARFGAPRGLSFVAVTVHTRPDQTLSELAHLPEVLTWAGAQFPGERNFLVLGDFNAGCAYANAPQLEALELRQGGYTWLVPDDADTTVGATHCAYDRIVVSDALIGHVITWGVDTALAPGASDHYPVWVELSSGPH
jgi:endonuclease/exonuclease/phosphatase family metal-dependent hydrolase